MRPRATLGRRGKALGFTVAVAAVTNPQVMALGARFHFPDAGINAWS
jgi:hypothetical protein